MTKPIIVVKMPCKLLYVIQVKQFLKCLTSWPYLYDIRVSSLTDIYNHCAWLLIGLTPFLQPCRLFLFSINIIKY